MNTSTLKRARKPAVLLTLTLALAATVSLNAQASTIEAGVVTGPLLRADHYGLEADYMWACNGAQTCSAIQPLNLVQFTQTFSYSKGPTGRAFAFGHGSVINPAIDPFGNDRYALSVIADDYYALYINNQLVHYSWLNNGGDAGNAAHFSNQAFNLTLGDMLPYLHEGNDNVIDIFSCDGPAGSNMQNAPGVTRLGGFAGCPNPSDNLYSWLLVSGGITSLDQSLTSTVFSAADFRSGNTDGSGGAVWNGTFSIAQAVPEPGSLALLALAMLGLRITRGHRPPGA